MIDTDFVRRFEERILTQDNRYTEYPLFLVQQKKRIWGMDPHYSDEFEWVNEDDHEEVMEPIDEDDDDVDGWRKVYYRDEWEFVTACFTEKGCEEYIAENVHNLNEPRIYAASLYRNREMISLVQILTYRSYKGLVDDCHRQMEDTLDFWVGLGIGAMIALASAIAMQL